MSFFIDQFQREQTAEEKEIADLRSLLERTNHVVPSPSLPRVGAVATGGLRKLDDGQSDSMAALHKQRKLEAQGALYGAWDSSPYREEEAPKPKNVVCKDETSSFVERVYKPLMKEKQAAASCGRGGTSSGGNGASSSEADCVADQSTLKPKHQEMIEKMMAAYRTEIGAPKTMRSPRTGRMREIANPATGRIALGRTVPRRSSSSRPGSGGRGSKTRSASPQQEAMRGRAEAAKAEAAARRYDAQQQRVEG